MDLVAEQARINAIRWYHEFDFGGGLQARSTNPEVEMHRRVWRFITQQLDQVDFHGKTVLDIGCWDGSWSFYAERRGARSVLAVDDSSQNWSDGRGIHLAKTLFRSNIEIDQNVSVYELSRLARRFDIVLMFGVYYHLLDPFRAFAEIRHCCGPDSLVLLEGIEALGLPAKTVRWDLGNRTSKFMPTREALEELLRAACIQMESAVPLDGASAFPMPGWGWRLRMAWRTFLGDRAGIVGLLWPLLAATRVFLTCRPIRSDSDAHLYKPPFGLDAYDDRFKIHGDRFVP